MVSYFGVADVADLLSSEHARDFAVGWLGQQPNRESLARRLSPLTYVGRGEKRPAVLIVHGDADPVVPYQQAVRLHEALGFQACGVVRDAGCKFGRWHDVGFWQRRLGPDGQPGRPLQPPPA